MSKIPLPCTREPNGATSCVKLQRLLSRARSSASVEETTATSGERMCERKSFPCKDFIFVGQDGSEISLNNLLEYQLIR